MTSFTKLIYSESDFIVDAIAMSAVSVIVKNGGGASLAINVPEQKFL